MPSRFYSQKDIDTFDKFNKELVGNLATSEDGIIYQQSSYTKFLCMILR